MTGHKNIPVAPETKRRADELKQASEAKSFDELVVKMMEDNLEVSWEEVELEESEETIQRTRATIVAVLEAVEELDLTEEVLDIVETLSQQDMLAKNQEIIDHLLEKARNDESLNAVDRLLAQIVMETERGREIEQSPAAEIAQGLFAETDTTTAERTTTNQRASSKTVTVSEGDESSPQETVEKGEFDFEGIDMSLGESDNE